MSGEATRETIHVNWKGKTSITLFDALTTIRYNARDKLLFPQVTPRTTVEKLHTLEESNAEHTRSSQLIAKAKAGMCWSFDAVLTLDSFGSAIGNRFA